MIALKTSIHLKKLCCVKDVKCPHAGVEYNLHDVYESDDCSDGAYSGIGQPRVTATCLAGGQWSVDIQTCEGTESY